jgi:curved DNA-binding protein
VRYSTGGFGGGGGINIEDLFGDMFSGGGGFGPVPGADQEAQLELSIEEAYRGGKRKISLGDRDYTVNIPAGIIDGQRIRLAGEGSRGSGDGPPGDLYLVVRIKPDKRFRLEGRDVIADLPVSPWEAVLGATVAVHTPGGEAKVKVPAGSSTGRRLRLRGEGMPNPKGKPGDLLAEIKIVVPAKPTARERELFGQLAAESTFDPRRSR